MLHKERVPLLARITLALAVCTLALHGFPQDKPAIVVKHFEPMRYPDLARLARLQGLVSIRLKISPSGDVIDAEAGTADTSLKAHPLLQKETVKLVRKWTFACANCPPNADYEHALTFVYRLEGREASSNDSQFKMDSPDHMTITTHPPKQGGY
jgi:TonB family protein